MQKNSFVLRNSYADIFADLSDKQAGALIKVIFNYIAKKDVTEGLQDVEVKMAWKFIKQDIDYDTQKYEALCLKRAEYGKQGGRPKAQGFSENQKKHKVFEKAKGFSEKHIDSDSVVDSDSDSENNNATLLLPQKDPQAGTFRATPKTKMQKFGTWWVKNYYPELYATAGAKATAAWFKRYGRALSELLSLADGSVSLAVSAALATQEQMAEFQKRKGETVLWGLESVCRNFTENFVRAQEIQKSGVLPPEVADA